MSKIAIFPGSFDPFTLGHDDVVKSALPLFDKVIIAIGQNSTKSRLFSLQKMVAKISELYSEESKIEIAAFSGLTVDFAKSQKASFIIRGLRNTLDFEYEKNISFSNDYLAPEIQTIFLLTNPKYSHISSTIVREIFKNQADISKFLPYKF